MNNLINGAACLLDAIEIIVNTDRYGAYMLRRRY